MRTALRLLCVGWLCWLSTACDDDEPEDLVNSYASATANFEGYQTYAFVEEDDLPDRNFTIPPDVATQLNAVNDAMRTELSARGLEEVDSNEEEPDLYAFNMAATQEDSALYWECIDSYWYGYWYWSWQPCTWLAPVYEEWEEGTIALGLADAKAEEIVFLGVIKGVIYDSGDADERIDEDVEKAFEAYPVAPIED